jgi:hypothetical protein
VTLPGFIKSKSQRRLFVGFSLLLVITCLSAALAVAWGEPGPKWLRDTLNGLLLSLVASGVFALFSIGYVAYFLDPGEERDNIVVLPQDLKGEMDRIATEAKDYKIYVRTGRYFRSHTLPRLIERVRSTRRPINIEVILLDFRDPQMCDLYARFRKGTFDGHLWSIESATAEILATAAALAKAALENSSLVTASLYLSARLSVFRIEGSADELLVTREGPKDFAYRFDHSHPDHGAYLTEFTWIRDTASRIDLPRTTPSGSLLAAMFGQEEVAPEVEQAVNDALARKAPYAS